MWLSLLNATVCTFAPVLMVMMAIERIGAPMAAQAGMVGPMSTILMGVVMLGEPFTAVDRRGHAAGARRRLCCSRAPDAERMIDMDLGIAGKMGAGVRRQQGSGQGLRAALVREGVNVVITARGAEALEAATAG